MKIFRKIRQGFLNENKFRKYLLYALGEIIIVIIGIFVALQLNISYENSKIEKAEIFYLKGILENLDQDIVEFNKLLVSDTVLLNSYTTIVRAFTTDSIRSDKDYLFKALNRAQYLHAFSGSSIVFEDMKSSGKINLIRSDLLRYSILRYYNESQALIKHESEIYNPKIIEMKDKIFITNIDYNSAEPYIFPDYWVSEVDAMDLSFFDLDIKSEKVKNFANRMTYIKKVLHVNNKYRKRVLEQAKALKKEVSTYLNSKN